MIAGNAFYGCFYRRGRTVTYVDGSGSQRWAPSSVQRHRHAPVCMCMYTHTSAPVHSLIYTYAVALTRLDRLHFPDERILTAIRQ